MDEHHRFLLLELAYLLEQYRACIGVDTITGGVYITVNGATVFTGHLPFDDAPDTLRRAAEGLA